MVVQQFEAHPGGQEAEVGDAGRPPRRPVEEQPGQAHQQGVDDDGDEAGGQCRVRHPVRRQGVVEEESTEAVAEDLAVARPPLGQLPAQAEEGHQGDQQQEGEGQEAGEADAQQQPGERAQVVVRPRRPVASEGPQQVGPPGDARVEGQRRVAPQPPFAHPPVHPAGDGQGDEEKGVAQEAKRTVHGREGSYRITSRSTARLLISRIPSRWWR